MTSWKIWLHGLVAALISGAAGGGSTALSSLALGDDFKKALKIAGVSVIISGAIGAFGYLKQSPVPPEWKNQG